MSDPNNPQINPGDISNWPMLKLQYPTDPAKLATLLPPGIEPSAEPNVTLTIYNFPVNNEPEFGIVTTVDADYNGIAGKYALGYGIDQEAAIFTSQQRNGQPKFPCETTYYRFGDQVEAKCCHHGYTFVEFSGQAAAVEENPVQYEENEWWIKVSMAAGMMPTEAYDYPPHVVRVRSVYGTARYERVEGTLKLGESPWDPIAELLPMRGAVTTHLWTPIFMDREINTAGALDPAAFLPHADVISGSRWPGENGGPKAAAVIGVRKAA